MKLKDLRTHFTPEQDFYELPNSMPAIYSKKGEKGKLELEVGSVPIPEISYDEALIAVMSAGINYNTIWTARGEPVSTFDFLKRHALTNNTKQSHNLDYHIPGSDASGFIVKLGTEDTNWKIGKEVVINCNWHRNDDPQVFEDSLLSSEQKIWGYETNFGSLAAFSIVKIHQLMPKPSILNWYESSSYSLVFSTAYRMLISNNGANIRPGDKVLIWGGSGGLGLSAIQICHLVGGMPIPVVSSDEKGKALKKLGVDKFINRKKEKLNFWSGNNHDMLGWRKFKNLIIKRFGVLPNVVFEHPGKETMAASIYVLSKGGKVVTCAATSGYDISYDNRYLWMESKSIIGCHFANPKESINASLLLSNGNIKPFISSIYDFNNINDALGKFVENSGFGKIVIRILAPDSKKFNFKSNIFNINE